MKDFLYLHSLKTYCLKLVITLKIGTNKKKGENMLFEPVDLKDQKARIIVVGVGGGGGNALNRMIEDGMAAVDFIAVNTDAQDLENNNSQIKLQIGKELTKGLGAGANAEIGKQAVDENKDFVIGYRKMKTAIARISI